MTDESPLKRQKISLSTTTIPTVIKSMELAMSNLISTTHTITSENIPEVPGAFILRSCLTPTECIALATQVKRIHAEWKESRALQQQAYELQHPEKTTSTSSAKSRRKSQHHLPCRVSPLSLANLCARIRPFVSPAAGPNGLASTASVLPPGHEISTFLRCYHYSTGDTSTPHYDKSFTTFIKPEPEPEPEPKTEPTKTNPGLGTETETETETETKLEPAKVAPPSSSSTTIISTQKTKLTKTIKSSGGRRGQLDTFSAYSILLYVNDQFNGGGTTFFKHDPTIRITRRGLTPVPEDVSKLESIVTVVPTLGDVLIFPHGKFPGCHPNPLHEGSIVKDGEKCLIRTDLIYKAPPGRKKKRKKNKKKKGK